MLPAKPNCHNEVSFKRFLSVRTHKTKKITQSCCRRKMEEKEDDTKISIADPIQDHQETTFSFDFRTEFLQDENKTPFFKPRSRRRRRDTCVIFAFVIIHLVVFLITMAVNDCGYNSHGDCAFKALGRMSFQPLLENPFLGPSASALDKMGAIRKTLLAEHQTWRLFMCPLLHAGVFHFMINLLCIIFLGIYLEKEFGSIRTGIIYMLSAFSGTLVTAIFVRDSPAVCSSGALFGLLGATVSALTRNWKFYTNKVAALLTLFFVAGFNLMLGLLPYMDNYSSIGSMISGFLLGLVLFYTPQLRQVAQNKIGLCEYGVKSSFNWKQKLDRPVLRSASLILFSLLFVGLLVAVLLGINISHYCRWCRYTDCIPYKRWSCNDLTSSCETMGGDKELTLTCMGNGNFRVFPFTNISQERTQDLCTLICS
uniref:RHOMBOID-like protein n=1 Tax=Populus trichocarpa TaxID=3694 RepID=A0A3N7EQT6_POPTR